VLRVLPPLVLMLPLISCGSSSTAAV